jgi:hypothetical protein
MKKLVWIVLVVLLLFPLAARSQQAVGLRFGGGTISGAEVSYQTPFQGERLEVDLGWGGNSTWHYWNLTGLYQWVMPIENGFNWYLGLGPSIGSWSYRGDDADVDGGLGLGLALNIGAEYNFSEVPLQIALDTRPTLNITDSGDDGWFGLALAFRYRF